jgi:hypothetical protein
MANGRDASVINVWSSGPVGCNIIRDILIENDKTSRAMMSTTSRQRAFKIANVSFVSVILSCQLQIFRAVKGDKLTL